MKPSNDWGNNAPISITPSGFFGNSSSNIIEIKDFLSLAERERLIAKRFISSSVKLLNIAMQLSHSLFHCKKFHQKYLPQPPLQSSPFSATLLTTSNMHTNMRRAWILF